MAIQQREGGLRVELIVGMILEDRALLIALQLFWHADEALEVQESCELMCFFRRQGIYIHFAMNSKSMLLRLPMQIFASEWPKNCSHIYCKSINLISNPGCIFC